MVWWLGNALSWQVLCQLNDAITHFTFFPVNYLLFDIWVTLFYTCIIYFRILTLYALRYVAHTHLIYKCCSLRVKKCLVQVNLLAKWYDRIFNPSCYHNTVLYLCRFSSLYLIFSWMIFSLEIFANLILLWELGPKIKSNQTDFEEE